VLQGTAVRCSMLQYVAVCVVLQYVSCCSAHYALRHAKTHCNAQ